MKISKFKIEKPYLLPNKNIPNFLWGRQAFTLVEVLVAMTILAAFTTAMVTIFPTSIKIISSGNQQTVAANLAQAKLESLRAITYDNLPTGIYENNVRADADPASPFYNFYYTVTINYIDDNLASAITDTGLKKIIVTLNWWDPLRGNQTTDISTLITKY